MGYSWVCTDKTKHAPLSSLDLYHGHSNYHDICNVSDRMSLMICEGIELKPDSWHDVHLACT